MGVTKKFVAAVVLALLLFSQSHPQSGGLKKIDVSNQKDPRRIAITGVK